MNKRSAVFSLMSIILLIPILVISSAYLDINKKSMGHAARFIYSQRIAYIENDIATDLLDILGYDVGITQSGRTVVRLENIPLADTASALNSYIGFIENVYNPLVNANISINLTPGLSVNNIDIFIANNSISVWNLSDLHNLTIHLRALVPAFLNKTAVAPGDFSGTEVSVVVENYYGIEVIDYCATINLSMPGSVFSAESEGKAVSIELSPNMLNISTNISAIIDLLEFGFRDNVTVAVKTGSMVIPSFLGIGKKSSILLARG